MPYQDFDGRYRRAVDGFGVYRSEEFQEFCQKFGIAWDMRTTKLVITLEMDEIMMVEHIYQGSTKGIQPDEPIETTDKDNVKYRTSSPRGERGASL